MFPRDMLVPARMQQQPWGHPSTGRQMPGKAHMPERDVANLEGRDLSLGAPCLSRGVGLFWLPGSFTKGGTLAPAHRSQ